MRVFFGKVRSVGRQVDRSIELQKSLEKIEKRQFGFGFVCCMYLEWKLVAGVVGF
jgi:hypothetical protein